MKYSTYVSAAERLSLLGQKKKATELIEHALKQEKKKIDLLKFDILVGEVKAFKDAKFHSAQVMKERESNTIMCIFQSEVKSENMTNTHRICASIRQTGEVVYTDGNLFLDRKSVKSFERLLQYLIGYRSDVRKLLREAGIDKSHIRLSSRTFYI
jgi:hypothetical protein